MQQTIFFAGTDNEVAHHAAPLAGKLDYQVLPPDEVVTHAKAGDLVIFFSEHFDRFRIAISELKTKNVATLYMLDGILEWRNAWENRSDEPACPFTMRPVLCHKAACIGYGQARILSSWGNADKVEVVGIPRLDSLTNRASEKQLLRDSQSKSRLLVMTAKFPSYTADQKQKLVVSLRDLKTILQRRTDIDVIWRLTAGLDQEIAVTNQLNDLTGADLADALAQCDAVISTPSTGLLESMRMGLPTAILDYTNSPSYVSAAWNITAADQIETEIEKLTNPAEHRIAFQQSLLAEALQLDESATDRMCRLIEVMLQHARQAIGGKMALPAYDKSLLDAPVPRDDAPAFSHAKIFSSFAEFQSDDTVKMQAELAHARREIKHLQMQIAQLESELTQAHQIFDEINNHPIAGPIVKIRQRLVTLTNKIRQSKIQPEL